MSQESQGHFIISLDFELFWGVFDVRDFDSYKANLLKVREIIPDLIKLADTYNVKLTFAVVGALFAKSREELAAFSPTKKPTYKNTLFNAYSVLDIVEDTEENNQCLFAYDLLKHINSNGKHEIASHTFSHYYCNEYGQTPEQFEADLLANIAIAKQNNIELKSIVFPRNQLKDDYLVICNKYGITNYRGTENNSIYKYNNLELLEKKRHRILRLFDTYINITGINDYFLRDLKETFGLNLKSSRFFRSYNSKLSLLEPLKMKRVLKAMTHAARNKKVYHIWWHPHNFGKNTEANLNQIEKLFQHYKHLNNKYNFVSVTMAELGKINTN